MSREMRDAAKRPLRYEAHPTRMFGAYTIWVSYADGTRAQLGHGTPQFCLAEADRLNADLRRSTPPNNRGRRA